jgi:cytochrome b561
MRRDERIPRYTATAQLFHWVTALLVLVTIPAGLVMTELEPGPAQNQLYILHKGIGATLILVVGLRLVWRLTHPAPPLEPFIKPWEARLAHTVHWLLYATLLVMVTSGYVATITGGFPIELLDALGVPPLLPENKPLSEVVFGVHHFGKNVLIGLLVLHIAGALRHAMIKQDGIFARMLPRFLG